MKPTVLNLAESFLSTSIKIELNKKFTLIELDEITSENILNVKIIWTHLKFRLDKNFLNRYKNLEFIISPTTGLNHLDIDYILNRKIKIFSLKNENIFLKKITSTAEHTWSLLLALHKNIIISNNDLVNNKIFNRNNYDSEQLSGKTLGIIGYGRIGKIISRYSKAFKMKYVFYDINNKKNKNFCDLYKLLKISDFVCLTASYSKLYHHFFNLSLFKMMKKNAVFINTARGELVNEEDLIIALNKKIIRGAGIDVYDNETEMDPTNNIMVKYASLKKNLILTPHIGGRSSEALELCENFLLRKLLYYYEKN